MTPIPANLQADLQACVDSKAAADAAQAALPGLQNGVTQAQKALTDGNTASGAAQAAQLQAKQQLDADLATFLSPPSS